MKYVSSTLVIFLLSLSAGTFLVQPNVSAQDRSNTDDIKPVGEADLSQAKSMLTYCKGIATNTHKAENIEVIMEQTGTTLILEQMNLFRKVKAYQYKNLLEGFADGHMYDIEPVDESKRAKKGVRGLREIWKYLTWGVQNIDAFENRLKSIRHKDFYTEASTRMNTNLPCTVDIRPEVYIVAGGRAGAAQLGKSYLLIDILRLDAFQARKSLPLLTDEEIIDTVAHEMHHMAYKKILSDFHDKLHLDNNSEMIFSILSPLILEGTATFMVSSHYDIRAMQSDPGFSEYLEKKDVLLQDLQNAMHECFSGAYRTPEEFENAVVANFLGHFYHATGSELLHTIYTARGKDGLFAVMLDPRTILHEYNKAVLATDSQSSSFVFEQSIVDQLLELGK